MTEFGRRPAVGALIGLAVGALVVLLLVSIVQTRQLTGQIRATQQQNTGTVRLIKDCTEPSGRCYKRGQTRTAQAVLGINGNTLRVIVAALTCQEHGYHGDALATCTARNASR